MLTLEASYIKWYSDFDKAHQEALKTDKSLLILLVNKMDKKLLLESFMNQDYIEKINEKYIAVLIKKDQESSYPIEMLFTTQYPSLFILNKHELFVCEALRGDLSADRLKAYLQECD